MFKIHIPSDLLRLCKQNQYFQVLKILVIHNTINIHVYHTVNTPEFKPNRAQKV